MPTSSARRLSVVPHLKVFLAVPGITFLPCTGSDDPLCTPEQIVRFSRALQDPGADWRVNI
jgi:hypothetical protein